MHQPEHAEADRAAGPNPFTRSLQSTKDKAGQILTITGTDRFRQTKKCRTQKVKNYDVTREITLTYQD